MSRIVALDTNIVNMIAAGEVVERPASVVKELMENSIDAQADCISVSVVDGGKKLISVTDNGCGMGPDDLAAAFESHTTSKVKTGRDLRTIATLGFRGEALPSIASVAQIRAVSRTKDSPSAHSIEIDYGKKQMVKPCSADYGTTIEVRDIFYKTPARRKFLKTRNTELSHVTEQFTRIALAHPEIDMTLSHHSRELYKLYSGQSIRHRIGELFSSQISENLIHTQSEEKRLRIRALLGRAEIARTNTRFQYIFLNDRYIRDKFINHAVREAYRGLLEPDRFPVVFLFIRMPYEDVDVNVHPTKVEVRFYNANLVHSQILGCLREKLLGTDLDAPAKITPAMSDMPPAQDEKDRRPDNQEIVDAMADFFKRHRPVQSQQNLGFSPGKTGAPGTNTIIERITGAVQIHNSYIIKQTEDGFVIIDQHALHERIIYEDLRTRLKEGRLESQKLLIPESFEMTDAQADAVDEHHHIVEKLGIELEPFGPKTMAVQAFPVLLSRAKPAEFIQDLLDLITDPEITGDPEKLLKEVMSLAACKAAIKAGQKLTDSEIRQLLQDRQRVESSSRCPHGRPTTIKFTIDELEKQFKRT